MKAVTPGVRPFIARARYITLLIALASALPAFAAASDPALSEAVATFCSRDYEKRPAARAALLEAGSRAVPEIVQGMRPARCRERLMKVVEKIGPQAFAPLLPLLKDPVLRNYAGSALARVAVPELGGYVPELLDCLRDENVRHSCGTALIAVMGPKASRHLPKIIEALKDREPQVRVYAAAALGRAGRKARSAVPALEAALQDADAEARRAAAEALKNING